MSYVSHFYFLVFLQILDHKLLRTLMQHFSLFLLPFTVLHLTTDFSVNTPSVYYSGYLHFVKRFDLP